MTNDQRPKPELRSEATPASTDVEGLVKRALAVVNYRDRPPIMNAAMLQLITDLATALSQSTSPEGKPRCGEDASKEAMVAVLDWVSLTKALFAYEGPLTEDGAWFDKQGKAQGLIRLMSESTPPREANQTPAQINKVPDMPTNVTEVDGCMVHGDAPMSPEGRAAISEVISTVRERLTVNHPAAAGDEGLREIIGWLRAEAKSASEFSWKMQNARTAEYQARGDTDAHYRGMEPHETIQWRFAETLSRLRALPPAQGAK